MELIEVARDRVQGAFFKQGTDSLGSIKFGNFLYT